MPSSRKRDLAFEALAAACGIPFDNAEVMHFERGRLNKALKLLRTSPGYTTDELLATQIKGKADAYREQWPSIELTPTALVHNWTRLKTKSSELSYECDICGWKFRSQGELNTHTHNFHADEEYTEEEMAENKARARKMMMDLAKKLPDTPKMDSW